MTYRLRAVPGAGMRPPNNSDDMATQRLVITVVPRGKPC